jgi:hypothetical protein
MKFRVQSPAEKIIDPVTGDELGSYPTWKVIIEPDQVFERFSIGSQPFGGDGDYEPDDDWPDLPVDPRSIQPLRPADQKIEVGDIVEQIVNTPLLPEAADDDIPF